jgi:hypothetical protein
MREIRKKKNSDQGGIRRRAPATVIPYYTTKVPVSLLPYNPVCPLPIHVDLMASAWMVAGPDIEIVF